MNRSRLPIILALLLTLSACATTENNHDPIEPANRGMDSLNDTVDRITLKPAAQGYTAVVPKPMRTAVSNFFDNATYLNTVLNSFLQGNGTQGISDLSRFLINTTLGAGGLVDVASSMGLERHDEDFGQTLAVWGAGQGAYIVYPLLGPNSVRNTPDFVTATATDPLFWAGFVLAPQVTIPVAVLKYVDKRAQLLDASNARDELALDPYIFTREAWRQNRIYKIYDGNPPKQESTDDGWEEDEDWSEDEFDDEPASSEASSAEQPDAVNDSSPATETGTPDTEVSTPVAETASAAPATADTSDSSAESTANPEHTADHTGIKTYIINLTSLETEAQATREQERLKGYGFETAIRQVNVSSKIWYRLCYAEQLGNKLARQKMQEIRNKTGLTGTWLEPAQQ
ncbi:phospholipid-binding lipoprotein MlaA [Mariprofundus micogutta]|uniref:Phospholipid-binding lipoprotein MlaA n=1 Tax=Mariprofundus micogutta TaxID=1921010 RepID=A0A1L8CPS6_9PROT|nr:MlaA family lipoprotein [Mariprofundus micogutta]GAV20884.1 phospholipid-binding lipoprotein MlaA [Mariprofundus micogutta]